jgi:hypothetical protein
MQEGVGATAQNAVAWGVNLSYFGNPSLLKSGNASTGVSVGLNASQSQYALATGIQTFTLPFTLELFVNTTLLNSSFQTLCAIYDATTYSGASVSINIDNSNTFRMDAYNGSIVRSINSRTLAVGSWYHVLCSFNSSTYRQLFVNGQSEGQNTLSLAGGQYGRISVGRYMPSFNSATILASHVAVYPFATNAENALAYYANAVADGPWEVPILWDLPDAQETFIQIGRASCRERV